MRIERAIDAFLDWREQERDSTRRTLDSYRRILDKLAAMYPEADLSSFDGKEGTQRLRDFVAAWIAKSRRERGVQLSAATRANITSVLHSFFGWAESEDHVNVDPSRKIQRPRKHKPRIERPQLSELERLRRASMLWERPAIVLMEGAGLRSAEVRSCRWKDIDLLNGRLQVQRKGGDWMWLPLAPSVLQILRECFREISPDLEDHVFTVEVEQWVSASHRERRRKDPKRAASEQALCRMVDRVCRRAGIRHLGPHLLRHGFANRLLRDSGKDLASVQALMGHARPDTTQGYTDELTLEELADVLRRAEEKRDAQASPDLATLGIQTLKYPRNPGVEAAGIEPESAAAPAERLQA